ncbi:MAG: hypothetical protein AAGE61_13440 [Pseudomonadota bacterium]
MSNLGSFSGLTNPAETAALSSELNAGTQSVVDEAAAQATNNSASSEADFEGILAELTASFKTAQIRNLRVNKLMVEEGTILKAAGKEPNPK